MFEYFKDIYSRCEIVIIRLFGVNSGVIYY